MEKLLANTTIEGGVTLVLFRSEAKSPLSLVANWMMKRIEENQRLNIETDVLIFQNILPYSCIRKARQINPESVNFFIFSKNPLSDGEFNYLKYADVEIGKTITEITDKRISSSVIGEIILIDLSILINTFGVGRTYNLLLNKLDILRKSGISLIAVIHEMIHNEQDLALFKSLADNIIVK